MTALKDKKEGKPAKTTFKLQKQEKEVNKINMSVISSTIHIKFKAEAS